MASVGWTVKWELRPCLAGTKKNKALFHQWYTDPYAGLVGIVEYEDGSVAKVTPKNIQFLDSVDKFAGYCWGEATENEATTEGSQIPFGAY